MGPVPGDPDYDPYIYADYIYHYFGGCFREPDCVVLLGELTPKWDLTKPLPHEMAIAQQERFYDNYDGHTYGVSYDYSDFYDFQGVQITRTGLVPLALYTVGLSVGIGEEGYWSNPIITERPSIFAAKFWVADSDVGLQVYDTFMCNGLPPAPDPAALAILTQCIANQGCP